MIIQVSIQKYFYIHTYIQTCMHARTHAYIHTYLHTYIHTYIHTLCIAMHLHVCHADTTLNQPQINYTHTQTIPK